TLSLDCLAVSSRSLARAFSLSKNPPHGLGASPPFIVEGRVAMAGRARRRISQPPSPFFLPAGGASKAWRWRLRCGPTTAAAAKQRTARESSKGASGDSPRRAASGSGQGGSRWRVNSSNGGSKAAAQNLLFGCFDFVELDQVHDIEGDYLEPKIMETQLAVLQAETAITSTKITQAMNRHKMTTSLMHDRAVRTILLYMLTF
ncbi:hypothetical protein Taro_055982, partial [Colocasia esculenta]|nr:hypothetical protein [Colocasia esculenta]